MVKEEKICEFISFVHSHPAFYNKADAEYKNNNIKKYSEGKNNQTAYRAEQKFGKNSPRRLGPICKQ